MERISIIFNNNKCNIKWIKDRIPRFRFKIKFKDKFFRDNNNSFHRINLKFRYNRLQYYNNNINN